MSNRTAYYEAVHDHVAAHLGDKVWPEMITTEKAAKIVGVSLRAFRYWEAAGQTPKREEPGTGSRRYRLDDIKVFADRKKKEKALLAMGYHKHDFAFLFSLPENELASLWAHAKSLGLL